MAQRDEWRSFPLGRVLAALLPAALILSLAFVQSVRQVEKDMKIQAMLMVLHVTIRANPPSPRASVYHFTDTDDPYDILILKSESRPLQFIFVVLDRVSARGEVISDPDIWGMRFDCEIMGRLVSGWRVHATVAARLLRDCSR